MTTAVVTEPASASCASKQKGVTRGWQRLGLLGLAAAFFCLAVLGAILPGIPGTPFLLLTSYCLVRSSPRMNSWLLRSRVFGPILVDWQVHGGVRMHVRCKAIVTVIIAVSASIYFAEFSLFTTSLVASLALIGIAVILKLPAAKVR